MMGNKNQSLFGELSGSTEEEKAPRQERKRSMGYLQERENDLSKLASGELLEKSLLWVDPDRCKIWELHNRRYDLLDEKRCADLIEGFRAQGHQEFPAVVRKLQNDKTFDYEVICGARRHWTVTWLRKNNYRDFKFLIDIRELTDEEAFRLSDVENRDKEDICDYERAVDYKKALSLYYKNQKQMAGRLEVSEGWLSKYVYLADIPAEVVSAFMDIRQIRVQHGLELRGLLKEPRKRQTILRRASEIAESQKDALAKGKEILSGQTVVKELKKSINAKKQNKPGTLAEYPNEEGKIIVSVTRQGRSGLVIRIPPGTGAPSEVILDACKEALKSFYP